MHGRQSLSALLGMLLGTCGCQTPDGVGATDPGGTTAAEPPSTPSTGETPEPTTGGTTTGTTVATMTEPPPDTTGTTTSGGSYCGLGNPLSLVDHCAGWTSANQQLTSHVGYNALPLEEGPGWETWKSQRLWTVADKTPCHEVRRLYCFEDGYVED